MPTSVHDGGDNHHVSFHGVNDSLGKTPGPALSVVWGDSAPSLRMTKNTSDGSLDFVQEFQPQSRNGAVVVFRSFREFRLGRRKEPILHLASR